MAIMCVKTVLGEDLIGDIEIREDTVEIDSPLMIMMVPTDKGQFSVGLAPYMVFSDEKKFTFNKTHIVLFTNPADQLRNQYHSITGKGIVVPTTPGLKLID